MKYLFICIMIVDYVLQLLGCNITSFHTIIDNHRTYLDGGDFVFVLPKVWSTDEHTNFLPLPHLLQLIHTPRKRVYLNWFARDWRNRNEDWIFVRKLLYLIILTSSPNWIFDIMACLSIHQLQKQLYDHRNFSNRI